MPNKTEEYLALACKMADSFSRQWEHWAEFLITAARLYKYSYPDQLMIYAQRPDATACAEYDVWNNKMNRYVRRGSKGIALLDESSGFPRLHYVFDVSDTAPRRNALYPDLWQINDSLKEPVRSMLAENDGVHSESFGQQLADVAGKLVQSYHELGNSIKAAEARMAEIAVMKTHIINYAKTRSIYEAYRKAGYSKRFLEANRESIALHKAAKAAFDEAGLKKLPKVKELSIEYVELLKKKKAEYPSYRKARERMQELMKAQKNVEMFFADNRSEQEQQQTR